jgi:hypothetical protein
MSVAGRPVRRWLLALLVIVLALGGFLLWRFATPIDLDAPPPPVVADLPDSLPGVSVSTIDARVTYQLATAVDSLEAAVPRSYGDIEERLPYAGNTRVSFAYALQRTPFRVHVVGQTVSVATDITYEGRVWYRPPIGPELHAGCGTGNDPKPRVHATLVSTFRLTPQWQLRTDTRVLRLVPFSEEDRDRCRLTILRIDVTDRMIEATRLMLEKNVHRFDGVASRWPVRAKFEKLWDQLQRPIFLTPGVYMEIHPDAVQLGEVVAAGDTVSARLRILASPRIVTERAIAAPMPLPDLVPAGQEARVTDVALDASISYPVASALMRKAVVGRSIEQAGHRVWIRDVVLKGIGGGRVALGVRLAGRVRGMLYFTGTPSLDPAHHRVHVPDLDFDAGTFQLLVRGLGWLRGVDIRDFLRAQASLPDSNGIGRLQALADGAVNRTLVPGVLLRGHVRDARGTGVHATTQALHLRAVANAEFTLALDKAPPMPVVPR